MPTFNFSSVPTAPAEIVKFFQMVEAVGVSAYLGAAPSIKNLDILEAAAYKVINDAGVLSGRAATYFKAFGAHEQAHVDALIATIQQGDRP